MIENEQKNKKNTEQQVTLDWTATPFEETFSKRIKDSSKLFKIPYIALLLILIFDVVYAGVVFAGFVKAGGYGQYLSRGLGSEFFDNAEMGNYVLYGLCISFSLMGIVYAIKHKGAKRILMIIFLGFQALLAVVPIALYIMYYILPENNSLNFVLHYYSMFAEIDEIITIIYAPLAAVSMLPLFIMFMIEKIYRKFVGYWFLIIVTHVFILPLLLIIFSHVVSAVILVVIIELITIGLSGYWLYQAITYKCVACGKLNALELVRDDNVGNREISVEVENSIKDLNGNQWGTVGQFVPGVEKTNMETYRCRYCGHEEKKIKVEKIAKI